MMSGVTDEPTVDPSEFFRAHVLEASEECRLWPYQPNQRYPIVRYTPGFQFAYSQMPVHVATCLAWHGEKPTEIHQAAHLCGVSRCWAGEHLAWKTPAENMADVVAMGRSTRGARCGHAKLTEEQVREIRALAASVENEPRLGRKYTRKSLAEQYGVTAMVISGIVNGKQWTWVE